MAVKENKPISIYRLFLKYLIQLSTAIIIFIICIAALVYIAFQKGIVLPANYTDNKLIELEEKLAYDFNENLLPPYCEYIILDVNDKPLKTNMSERNIRKTMKYLQENSRPNYELYKTIYQANGHNLVVKYDMFAHFSNSLLHRIMPYPEIIIILLLVSFIILFSIITALKFSKNLKSNLMPIISATKKIETKDLNFSIEPTKIIEFNTALQAIEKLKEALSLSLKEQWDSEQEKKSQLSALTHDIKTPLTVIKGNTELLIESDPLSEDTELLNYIKTSSETIEKYLDLLMSIVTNHSLKQDKKIVNLSYFVDGIKSEAAALCKLKNIHFKVNINTKCRDINIDYELLKRAILNIIDNAVRYSSSNSIIEFIISDNQKDIRFEVIDYAKGFSNETLKRATQEFFTEETSRSNHHYGLGLNFSKKIAEIHDGTLKIQNHKHVKGAIVSLVIKII